MTTADRIALLNKTILAVRSHGMMSETVLEPLQTLRDDLVAEAASQPVEPSKTAPRPLKDAIAAMTAAQPAPDVPAK